MTPVLVEAIETKAKGLLLGFSEGYAVVVWLGGRLDLEPLSGITVYRPNIDWPIGEGKFYSVPEGK